MTSSHRISIPKYKNLPFAGIFFLKYCTDAPRRVSTLCH